MSVRVKICGVTRPDQARAVHALGADYIGVVFAPSPRRVELETACAIRTAAPDARLVGVFVNEPAASVRTIAERVGLNAIQLHGDEGPEASAALEGFEVIKAIFVDGPIAPDDPRIAAWPAILLDKAASGARGGTGRSFDPALVLALAGLARPRVFVAGGLRPDNVAAIVRRIRPYAVDVSSGVEAAPGVKDMALVEQFIRNAKETT